MPVARGPSHIGDETSDSSIADHCGNSWLRAGAQSRGLPGDWRLRAAACAEGPGTKPRRSASPPARMSSTAWSNVIRGTLWRAPAAVLSPFRQRLVVRSSGVLRPLPRFSELGWLHHGL